MNNLRFRARLIRTRSRRSFSHVYYSSPTAEEKAGTTTYPPANQKTSILRLLEQCERDALKLSGDMIDIGTRRMVENKLFHEHVIPMTTNKVFCSEWLPDGRIIMGTKCNQLVVYDVKTKKFTYLPRLENSSCYFEPPILQNGIHAISTNPSKTCLVTGGPHSNDVAVYTIPDLKPLCVGECAHKDWVFDVKWIDDEHFVSGSREGYIALWSISNLEKYSHPDGYHYIKPLIIKNCKLADKVRVLSFQPTSALTALSSNSYLHHWDMQSFEQMSSHKLPYSRETVSLAHSADNHLFAVGSSSHVTFVDSSSHAFIRSMKNKFRESSVRSLSFNGNIVTIGTGFGMIHFYDLVAGKYMDNSECVTSPVPGIFALNLFEELFVHTAIYTHSYDPTGTRLFAAGGPWALNMQGCYAALWM